MKEILGIPSNGSNALLEYDDHRSTFGGPSSPKRSPDRRNASQRLNSKSLLMETSAANTFGRDIVNASTSSLIISQQVSIPTLEPSKAQLIYNSHFSGIQVHC